MTKPINAMSNDVTNAMPNAVHNVFERGIFAVYGTLWRAARPLLRRHKRLREEFAMRLVPETWGAQSDAERAHTNMGNAHADIWVQAASGGEAYLAWEWLKALPFFASSYAYESAEAEPRILLTSCTRQGLDVLNEASTWAQERRRELGLPPMSIAVHVFPLDEPRLMRRALHMVSPRMLILLETELWPSLMRACRETSVPVMVLNGRMSPKSFAAYFFMRSFWKGLAPQRIAAISHDDAMRFSMLFGTVANVVPNMKFDRLCARQYSGQESGQESRHTDEQNEKHTPKAHALTLMHEARTHGERITLFASVREEEEPLLVATLCAMLKKKQEGSPRTQTIIIAPRHMHRVHAWQERLHRVGLHPVLRSKFGSASQDGSASPKGIHSQNENASQNGTAAQNKNALRDENAAQNGISIIIWDTFGELGALYGLADAVFVGGSLMPLGGQNFLEPLANGRIPCVGPYLHNFAWVEPQSLVDAGLLNIVQTDTELATALCDTAHADVIETNAVRARFDDWLATRLGGASISTHMTLDMLAENNA